MGHVDTRPRSVEQDVRRRGPDIEAMSLVPDTHPFLVAARQIVRTKKWFELFHAVNPSDMRVAENAFTRAQDYKGGFIVGRARRRQDRIDAATEELDAVRGKRAAANQTQEILNGTENLGVALTRDSSGEVTGFAIVDAFNLEVGSGASDSRLEALLEVEEAARRLVVERDKEPDSPITRVRGHIDRTLGLRFATDGTRPGGGYSVYPRKEIADATYRETDATSKVTTYYKVEREVAEYGHLREKLSVVRTEPDEEGRSRQVMLKFEISPVSPPEMFVQQKIAIDGNPPYLGWSYFTFHDVRNPRPEFRELLKTLDIYPPPQE